MAAPPHVCVTKIYLLTSPKPIKKNPNQTPTQNQNPLKNQNFSSGVPSILIIIIIIIIYPLSPKWKMQMKEEREREWDHSNEE